MSEINYFEFYDLPISFGIDEQKLKKKFYELSKHYHPDFYVNEDEEKQAEILELSTLNNKAFQVLSDPLKRIEYILGQHNLLADGDKHVLPQEFLMDMMDVNEALMEMEFDQDAAKLAELTQMVDGMEKSLLEELNQSTEEFDRREGKDVDSILLTIKDIWYRQKYLLRIRESMNKFRG